MLDNQLQLVCWGEFDYLLAESLGGAPWLLDKVTVSNSKPITRRHSLAWDGDSSDPVEEWGQIMNYSLHMEIAMINTLPHCKSRENFV